MWIVESVFKQVFYSIKFPYAFQVAHTIKLPQPPTLLGALASALCLAGSVKLRSKGVKYYDECLNSTATLGLRAVSAAPASLALTITSALLRRWRLENVIKNLKADSETFKRKVPDAMVREYVYCPKLVTFYIFDKEEGAEEAVKALWSVERLGDTESLTTCTEVYLHKASTKVGGEASNVKTYFPLRVAKHIYGNYHIVKMQPLNIGLKSKRTSSDIRSLEEYVFPLEVRYDEKTGLNYYVPTQLHVQLSDNAQAVQLNSKALGAISIPLLLNNYKESQETSGDQHGL